MHRFIRQARPVRNGRQSANVRTPSEPPLGHDRCRSLPLYGARQPTPSHSVAAPTSRTANAKKNQVNARPPMPAARDSRPIPLGKNWVRALQPEKTARTRT